MALRIGGMKQPAPEAPAEEPMDEEMAAMPEEMPEETPEETPEEMPEETGGVLDPMVAGYKGPEMGPFACANCAYFKGPNACSVVAGMIDPDGICNVFMSGSQGEEPMPEEEAPEEAPEEIPAEEEPTEEA